MTKDEKLSKVVRGFLQLPEGKQDYVLGILQALVFASGRQGTVEPVHIHVHAETCHVETNHAENCSEKAYEN